MKLILKRGSVKDVRCLALLDRIAHKERSSWTPQSSEEFARSIKKPGFCFLIAYSENEPLGYIESEYDPREKAVWIKNIFVLKEFRSKGVAKLLIKSCRDSWSKKTDLFLLLTADRNLNIFKKLGFKKTMNYMVSSPKK